MMKREERSNLESYISALESGEYRQGKAQLFNGHCFCAVGVACDLFKERLGIDVETDPVTGACRYDGSLVGVPPGLLTLIRINWSRIMIQNDLENMSFEDIAKWLRKEYLDAEA